MQTFNHIIANFAVTALVSLLWTVLKHNNVCQLHFTNQHSAACHIHVLNKQANAQRDKTESATHAGSYSQHG